MGSKDKPTSCHIDYNCSITAISISSERTLSKHNRVVDSWIKRTSLLTLIVLCAFFALFPNAGIGPILGSVANDLNDTNNMSWYMTVFSLSSTIFQLLGIRVSECLGRRRTLLGLTGSSFIITLVCGFSVNSEMLIACRLIQGCSMGAIISVLAAVLVDLFDMKDRLKYQPLIDMALGACFIVGPILGSVFTDHLSWRYLFWLTAIFLAPITLGFYYLVEIPLEPEQNLSKENLNTLMHRIDPVGCILITIGMTFFLLGMHLGSSSEGYTWSSPLVIGFLAASGFLMVLFLAFEKFIVSCPLFPSPVILDIHLILCYVQQFVTGWQFILFDILIFIQYQAVYDLTPTEASLRLLPALILSVIGSIVGGKVSYKLENPKLVVIAGNILTVASGILILFVQKMDSSTVVQVVIITIYQFGVSLCYVSSALCYQMILEKKAPDLVATSISLGHCFNRCGATISTAIVLSLLHSQTADDLDAIQNTQSNVYNDILTYDAGFNYVNIKDIPSIPAKQTLHVMYYENIRIIIYSFLAWNIISLFSSIFTKVPSISKKPLDGKPENY